MPAGVGTGGDALSVAEESALDRFVEAQESSYSSALTEIQRGAKRSHWMWFIFPQLVELERSSTAKLYGIGCAEEARAFLDHPVLGQRYLECVGALQDLASSDPVAVFGSTDAMKLKSSLTLFESVRPVPLFNAALERWFGGERDPMTLQLLASERSASEG